MLGSLSTFQSLAILRADYEENPEAKVSIIHKRTFWVKKINYFLYHFYIYQGNQFFKINN